ncbi:methyltransferase domain-containing protein [Candidatus Marinimicrobia bacterium MT.SAG.4]|nr:methyltransferase domain-containing protein [Candidatus Marinimicrobia bacterium MT.SAG.4]
MNCCSSENPAGKFFDKESKKFAKKYRKKGLEKVTKMLIEGIEELGIDGKTILEVGGGVGGAHRKLIHDGASKAYATELSQEMINIAAEFAKKENIEDKVEYILGDIVEMNGEVPNVDITMHDKVVCCYEFCDVLIERTLQKTKNTYAFIMPRDKFRVKIGFLFFNVSAKLFNWDFSPFIHPVQPILDKIEGAGFRLKYENTTFIWHVRVYEKTA